MEKPAPLARFSPAARRWFSEALGAPTQVQAQAWAAISTGKHTLAIAPTGSGKTLAAFFWALDALAHDPGTRGKTRVVYVTPLKALGVDVERNLRAPLAGIREAARKLGAPEGEVSVGIRSGDTSPRERAQLQRHPPDVLITTPESLYLMLTSRAATTLDEVECVIVDEIHAIADGKRGTHLALTLERLDALVGRDVQRIALSATVRPVERIAEFLGGDRGVEVVAPPGEKSWDVKVRVPVEDLADPGLPPGTQGGVDDGSAVDADATGSLWPHVEAAVYESVMAGESTIVFTNSRRQAERLTARLNEIWATEHDPQTLSPAPRRPPAQVIGQSGTVSAAPQVIARAHHGSVSKEARAEIEQSLKSGELKCVVSTSSLELGIDMGAVDRVIQISAPPSVASALQRIGRAGHSVGSTSAGDVYPMFRADLVPATVTTSRMLRGEIEELRIPRSPLDVLAQQSVAAVVAEGERGLAVDDWYATVRRSSPYAALERTAFDSVVELLCGAYPSADFGSLRARLVIEDGRLFPRPGALRLAVTSGGTIPDRGLYGVFLASSQEGARRVGELDEEMVYESRVGDVFTLGASSWRIEEINRDQVIVTPAPGHTGRVPFWKGDLESRPAELGRELGRFTREVLRDDALLSRTPTDANTNENLLRYLREQRDATGAVPDEGTILLERFRDEVGDWRFVLHSFLGHGVLAPWALVIGEAIRRATGLDVTPLASNDGIIWRLPDGEAADRMSDFILPDVDDVADIVTQEVGGSALFAARFRECAARALLLPRRDPGRRQPLWQQRQRAGQLLEIARLHPRFPIIIETVREVLQDVYDVPALIETLRRLERGAVRIVEVTTETPSPFAATMLFSYTGANLYDDDQPLSDRRAAALSMDPALLAAVLGTVDLRELLDPEVIEEVESQLQHTAADRRVASAGDVADLLRLLGPVSVEALPARVREDVELNAALADERVAVVELAGREHAVAAADLPLLRDALGTEVPTDAGGLPTLEPGRDPLTQLVARYARSHAPFTVAAVAEAFGLGASTARLVLEREAGARRLVQGHFTPGRDGLEYSDPEVLRRIRARCLAIARAQVQPVSHTGLARFLTHWHGVDDRPVSSPDEVLLALQRLAGAVLPASAWETHVLRARLRDYRPVHLDELIAEGEVVIRVRGQAGPNDPLVALVPADDVDLVAPPAAPDEAAAAFAEELGRTGGLFSELRSAREAAGGGLVDTAGLVEELWHAVEAGAVAPMSMSAIRARLGGSSRGAHRASRPSPRRRARLPRPGRAPFGRPSTDGAPAEASGRWYPVREPESSPPEQAVAQVSAWLERHGVVTRGAVAADRPDGGFAAAYRVMAGLEESGKLLRGYVVDGLGGAQFASPEAIDQIRGFADAPDATDWPSGATSPTPVVLAALDPANPYGSVVPWPEHPTARPARSAGALVVLADGVCLAHLTRGGRTLTLFPVDRAAAPGVEEVAGLVASALVEAVAEGRMSRFRIDEIDGERPGNGPVATAMRAAGARVTPQGLAIG